MFIHKFMFENFNTPFFSVSMFFAFQEKPWKCVMRFEKLIDIYNSQICCSPKNQRRDSTSTTRALKTMTHIIKVFHNLFNLLEILVKKKQNRNDI